MSKIDDLNDDPDRSRMKRLEDLERTASLGNSSVSQGQTQFIGLLSLLVSGSAKITGELIIDGDGGKLTIIGDVDGHGEFHWDGPAEFTNAERALTVTGPSAFSDPTMAIDATGPVKLDGTTEITKKATLKADLEVTDDGKIIVNGPIPLVLQDGALTVGGGVLTGAGAGISLNTGNAGIETFLGLVRMFAGGETATMGVDGSFDASGDFYARGKTTLYDLLSVRDGIQAEFLPTKVGVSPNLWIDPADGKIYRII